ncbi:MAG: PPC domain-containing DNA-binding protein [Cyanobacteria bacterium J06626_18]
MMACPLASTGLATYVLRLSPGEDLKNSLQAFTQDHAIAAGCIITAVGSLQQASLRFANQATAPVLTGRFEIVSLVGTLSLEGLHLHGAIADPHGQTLGGHVMPGCLIYTTAEIIVGSLSGAVFRRTYDAQTGYRELSVERVVGNKGMGE